MTRKEKMTKLAEIMGVPESSIIMDPDTFEIEEIYNDKDGTSHYRVSLRNGMKLIERPKK